MRHLQAVLDEIKAEDERGTCCGGGRLPESQGPRLPTEGSGSPREDAKDCEKPENYDLKGNSSFYATKGVECVEAIQAVTAGRDGFEGYLIGQCMKYLWRVGRKGPPELDCRKALWYLNRLILKLQEDRHVS